MIYYFFITALFGACRDYSKFKKLSLYKFLRSPIVTIIFFLILKNFNIKFCNIILFSIILERWFFLLIKTYISILNDDYNNKKYKYKIKYNIKIDK